MLSATGMAATFGKDDTQPAKSSHPFTKCPVDFLVNLFANIVLSVDTAVAPNWRAHDEGLQVKRKFL